MTVPLKQYDPTFEANIARVTRIASKLINETNWVQYIRIKRIKNMIKVLK